MLFLKKKKSINKIDNENQMLDTDEVKAENEFESEKFILVDQEDDLVELNAESSKIEVEAVEDNSFIFEKANVNPITAEENKEIVTLISEIEKEVPELLFSDDETLENGDLKETEYEVYRNKLINMFEKHDKQIEE